MGADTSSALANPRRDRCRVVSTADAGRAARRATGDAPAPPAQAAAYVAAHYPPETTLIAAAGSFRAAQVELPA
jgi:hypothetical protein